MSFICTRAPGLTSVNRPPSFRSSRVAEPRSWGEGAPRAPGHNGAAPRRGSDLGEVCQPVIAPEAIRPVAVGHEEVLVAVRVDVRPAGTLGEALGLGHSPAGPL